MPEFDIHASDGPIGAEILGLDVSRPITDAAFAELESAFNRYSVVVIRNQDLTPQQLVAFSRRFGLPQVNVRAEVTKGDVPEITLISNITENGKPVGSHDAGRYWHSDLCYLEVPSKMTLLHAIEVPECDGVAYGDTQFAGVATAYDALPDTQKRRIDGLKAANGYRYMWNKKARQFGIRPVLNDRELEKYPPDAIHPVVRTHPVTGRKCLFVCEGYTREILGLSQNEGRRLLKQLLEHIVRPDFLYRHKWRVGDLLMWDNCAVQHKATNDYAPPLRRLMQRCTIEGTAPF
jgi:taurine dioxygenase